MKPLPPPVSHRIRTTNTAFVIGRDIPMTRNSKETHIEIKGLSRPSHALRGIVIGLFSGFRTPLLVPSVFCDPEGLALERAQGRTRKMEAGMLSLLIHAAVLSLAFLMVHQAQTSMPRKDDTVFVNYLMTLPFDLDGGSGGGGGGGKSQPVPAAFGRLPQSERLQMMPPDVANPEPLVPLEDSLSLVPSVQVPIDIPQDLSMSIGDITAPFSGTLSSGPGIGSGTGPGAGLGSHGGLGGGPDIGIGKNLGPPIGWQRTKAAGTTAAAFAGLYGTSQAGAHGGDCDPTRYYSQRWQGRQPQGTAGIRL